MFRVVIERGPDKAGPASSTGGSWHFVIKDQDGAWLGFSCVYFSKPEHAEKLARALFQDRWPIEIDRSKPEG